MPKSIRYPKALILFPRFFEEGQRIFEERRLRRHKANVQNWHLVLTEMLTGTADLDVNKGVVTHIHFNSEEAYTAFILRWS